MEVKVTPPLPHLCLEAVLMEVQEVQLRQIPAYHRGRSLQKMATISS